MAAFCTVFDCMDGRCQEVVGKWCREHFRSDFPDTITIAGCDGVMASDATERARALAMARISAEKHGATQAVVVGHSGCAGFPVSVEEHIEAIRKAVEAVREAGIFKTIVGLFEDVETKTLQEVCRV